MRLPQNQVAFVYSFLRTSTHTVPTSPFRISPFLPHYSSTRSDSASMTWTETWKDILDGGHPRWKDVDPNGVKVTLGHILQHQIEGLDQKKILCPLAGDDPFVFYAWENGYDVTAMDLVPDALASLRRQFGPDDSEWTKSPPTSKENTDVSTVVWKHNSGRVTLYEGDFFSHHSELQNAFDIVYDKDSFGALPKDLRPNYCQTVADYTKDGAVVYLEVKKKDDDHPGLHDGPPFSVDKDDIMHDENFGQEKGSMFEYVTALGKVYDIYIPKATQTGHILRRTAK